MDELAGKHLDPMQFCFTCSYTSYAGHATKIARKAVQQGVDVVAAVGGDGSVNEVARSIIGSQVKLAIIPVGSGNGLARALGIPRQPIAALKVINQFLSRKLDIGFANGQLFLSNAGVGFDALIAKRFAASKKRGFIHYARLVLKNCLSYQPAEYHLLVDGKKYQENAFFISVANSNQIGYNFKIAPQAELDDGFLNIVIMKPLNLIKLGQVTVQSLTGLYLNNKNVRHLIGKNIRISGEHLDWMQLDGDALGVVKKNSVRISVRHHALTVIAPGIHPQ